ncbi:hypothetical protein V8E36_000283 [Tilletia maclaganii]
MLMAKLRRASRGSTVAHRTAALPDFLPPQFSRPVSAEARSGGPALFPPFQGTFDAGNVTSRASRAHHCFSNATLRAAHFLPRHKGLMGTRRTTLGGSMDSRLSHASDARMGRLGLGLNHRRIRRPQRRACPPHYSVDLEDGGSHGSSTCFILHSPIDHPTSACLHHSPQCCCIHQKLRSSISLSSIVRSKGTYVGPPGPVIKVVRRGGPAEELHQTQWMRRVRTPAGADLLRLPTVYPSAPSNGRNPRRSCYLQAPSLVGSTWYIASVLVHLGRSHLVPSVNQT